MLEEELQLAQQVLVAEGVESLVFEIGFPEVVDEPAVAVGENTKRIHGFDATVAMHAKKGQQGGGRDMEPMEFALHTQSAFVGVDRRGLSEALDDGSFHRSECFAGTGVDGGESSHTQGLTEEIPAELAQTIKGKELLVGKVKHQAPEVRAVLDGSLDVVGERGAHVQSGDRAAFDFGAMLGHLQAHGREIKNLAAFVIEHGRVFQPHPAALPARAGFQRMDLRVVGRFHLLERVAAMTGLAAGLASGFFPQAARSRLVEPVAGGRLAAVGTVELETARQFAHLVLQSKDALGSLLGFEANQQQHLLPAAAQLAHSASRKFSRRGRSHTALGAACGIIVLFWRVRPVVTPTMRQLAAR